MDVHFLITLKTFQWVWVVEIMVWRIEDAKVTVGCPPSSSSSGEEWKSFQFHIHNFPYLDTTKNHYIASPEFTCNGRRWELRVFPGGASEADEGDVSAFLNHLSVGTITVSYDMKIFDTLGKTRGSMPDKKKFTGSRAGWGSTDFIPRSDILDESQNILDCNGMLTVVVSMEEEPTDVFVPKNPLFKMMQKMFNDEATADICFELGSADEKGSSVSFYAHRLILEMCAPMLAAICGSNDNGEVETASVNDIKPGIFQHLLSYVYGGSVPEEELKADAKDIIDAADKYSIVNLKLEVEAAFVESTDISFDNAMDNLLYAYSRNCALLKEAVMNFLADNHLEASERIDFTDCPGHVVKDLLVAFGRKGAHRADEDDLATLSVSALRRRLDKMGLEVDGSREAMIESIKSHS